MVKFRLAALALAATSLVAVSARADITVGLITSMSGPISSIGVPYSKGIAAGIAQIGEISGQKIKLVQGIPSEKAKIIVAAIKDSKKKAQASIQGDTVRVVSKDKDTLQEVMALLRGKDIGVALQFTNFRSN